MFTGILRFGARVSSGATAKASHQGEREHQEIDVSSFRSKATRQRLLTGPLAFLV
jgi:hypothetical protein